MDAGRLVVELVRRDVRPSQIVTREALENAVASVAATGGSTNGVLHLLAIAREFGIPFTIDDFDEIAARTPVRRRPQAGRPLTSRPTSTRPAASPSSRASWRSRGSSTPDAPTVDGRTLGEVGARASRSGRARRSSRPIEKPIKPSGALRDPARQPRARGLRRQARRPRAASTTAARRACSTPRRTASPRSRRGRSRPATSSSSATRARPAAPGCARCSHVTAAIVGEGLGDDGRADHRRTLLRRDARLHGRPRLAGGGRAAARSPPSATATRSRSTSTRGRCASSSPTTRSPRG